MSIVLGLSRRRPNRLAPRARGGARCATSPRASRTPPARRVGPPGWSRTSHGVRGGVGSAGSRRGGLARQRCSWGCDEVAAVVRDLQRLDWPAPCDIQGRDRAVPQLPSRHERPRDARARRSSRARPHRPSSARLSSQEDLSRDTAPAVGRMPTPPLQHEPREQARARDGQRAMREPKSAAMHEGGAGETNRNDGFHPSGTRRVEADQFDPPHVRCRRDNSGVSRPRVQRGIAAGRRRVRGGPCGRTGRSPSRHGSGCDQGSRAPGCAARCAGAPAPDDERSGAAAPA